MILNETPVRTSKNFNINNIELTDFNIPTNIPKFNNVTISDNISITENTTNFKLKYGLGDILENQVKSSSNKKIKINIEKNIAEPILIDFNFNKDNLSLIEDIEICASENKKANIIIKYRYKEDIEYYHNGIIRLNTKPNSNINISIINLLNEQSYNFLSIENILEENSKINYCNVDFGGKNSITNYYSNLKGNNSNNQINCIYLGKQNQFFDLNFIGELYGEKSNIDIEVQGALKDNAKKHFKGTIDFKKGSKKSKGNENEFCMLMSDTSKSIALPMLLCGEEDVEGNHSSAAGKVDNKQLFYIMSRGFNYKEAMKLIVKARFNNILENLRDEKLKNEIIYEIDKRLD